MTEELKEIVCQGVNESLGAVAPAQLHTFFRRAPTDKMYPHCVYSLDNGIPIGIDRMDVNVIIDVWTKSPTEAGMISDALCDKFNALNISKDKILVTFFVTGRYELPDEDPLIYHNQIKIVSQVYEMEE